jgi:hypothetical protein
MPQPIVWEEVAVEAQVVPPKETQPGVTAH